jgi:protease-4
MYKYSSWYNYGMIDIADIIKAASASENVSAIVLDIDSGGGSTAAIPPLQEAIALAKARGKIIVAHGDTTCSAAYWIASLCDYVFVNNVLTSTWGSIGVMMSFADYEPYFEKLGVVFHTIYADESEDKNKIFTEALKKNYKPIKADVLSPLAKAFQSEIKQNRGAKLVLDTKGILSGKTYTGITVVNIGLADEIGTLTDAIKYAANLAIAKNFENNY